jgi:hypothetical protein
MAGMTFVSLSGIVFFSGVVFFHGDEVLFARPVASVDEGEDLIAHLAQEMVKRKKGCARKVMPCPKGPRGEKGMHRLWGAHQLTACRPRRSTSLPPGPSLTG